MEEEETADRGIDSKSRFEEGSSETMESVSPKPGPVGGLETIDSDEEDIDNDSNEVNADVGQDGGRAKSKICDKCRLLFMDETSLREHLKTENHEMVQMGFKPSVGTVYCFLCWQGCRDSSELSGHFASKEHEENVVKNKVKAVCPSAENEKDEVASKRPRLDIPDVIPDAASGSDLGVVRRLNRDEWICEECNVVFITYLKAKDHSKSPNHLSVLEHRYPPIMDHQDGKPGFYCLLCWFGFKNIAQLTTHYSSGHHFRTMKYSGVTRMFRDERVLPLKEWPSIHKVNEERHDGLIVLDEVRGSDEDDTKISDTLDEVSSDEEALEKVDSARNRLGLEGLEDVDSEEEKPDEPSGLADVVGLEDVDSSEDELPGPPVAPPPPIISQSGPRALKAYSLSTNPDEHFDKNCIDSLKPVPAVSRIRGKKDTE